jgi:hypothetical protein
MTAPLGSFPDAVICTFNFDYGVDVAQGIQLKVNQPKNPCRQFFFFFLLCIASPMILSSFFFFFLFF